MTKAQEGLGKAIIAKAMREPLFMAKLLQDPMGFLKSLAGPAPAMGMNWLRHLKLRDSGSGIRFTSRMVKHS